MKVDKPTLSQLFDYYGDLLTAKQRECFDLYCNEDDTLAEIAELGSLTATRLRKCEKALCRLIFLSIFTFCCCSTPGTML